MYPRPIQKAATANRVFYRVVVVVILLLWLAPFLAMLSISARSLNDIVSGNVWRLPTEIRLIENYLEIFTGSPMLRYILNSFIVTIPAMVTAVFISSMAGYSLAMHRFRGRYALFLFFIAGNFVPGHVLMIPVRQLVIRLGIYDTRLALIIAHTAFQSGFCTFFLRNFIVELPYSLIDSARMDGASEWQIYFRIIMPLLRPALAALAVLTFTFIWNDFFWALVLIQSNKVRTVTIGLREFGGRLVSSWNLIAAGSMVTALPPVILFFAMQKHLIRGLTFGAKNG